jgi:hypothetical protein
MTHPRDDRFRPVLSPESAERLWDRFGESQRRRDGRRTLRRAVLASTVLAACMAGAVLLSRVGEPIPLALASGAPLAPSPGGVLRAEDWPLRLADGSVVTALSPAPDLAVMVNDGQRLLLHLGTGGVHFSVTPGGARHWLVETDLATVEVVGTVFDVLRDARGLTVRVDHGVVLVRGELVPGRMQRLMPGAELRVAAPEAVDDPVPGPAAPATPSVIPKPAANSSSDGSAPPAPHRTQALLSLDDELDRFEALRRQGRGSEARQAMKARIARSRDASERLALTLQLARWSLRDGDPEEAARVLETHPARGGPPELAAEARRLKLESWRAAGRDDLARELDTPVPVPATAPR